MSSHELSQHWMFPIYRLGRVVRAELWDSALGRGGGSGGGRELHLCISIIGSSFGGSDASPSGVSVEQQTIFPIFEKPT